MQAVTVSIKQCLVLSIPKIKKRGCLQLHPVFRPLCHICASWSSLKLSLVHSPARSCSSRLGRVQPSAGLTSKAHWLLRAWPDGFCRPTRMETPSRLRFMSQACTTLPVKDFFCISNGNFPCCSRCLLSVALEKHPVPSLYSAL